MAGVISAIVNIFVTIFLNNYLPYFLSIIFGYISGMFVSFVINDLFVFKRNSINTKEKIIKFLFINFVNCIIVFISSLLLLYLLKNYLNIKNVELISHCIAVTIPTFSTFIFFKLNAFKDKYLIEK